MSGHGGARRGAGRPRKWSIDDVVRVGQACEELWRDASEKTETAELDRLHSEASDLNVLWAKAGNVPVSERSNWLVSEEADLHRLDIETELHALHGTSEEAGPPVCVVRIRTQPPRGTRKQIIATVAKQFGERESTVDNLWQRYRRFVKEARNDWIPPES